MQVLVKHPGIDVDIEGELGSTPFHYAAAADRVECLEILVFLFLLNMFRGHLIPEHLMN